MSYYFLCSQNKHSKNRRFFQCMVSDFVAAEFPKPPSPKPARIPPQTPPAGGKSAEAGRIHSPRQIVSPCRVLFSSLNHLDFSRNSFELCLTNTARKDFSSLKGLPRGGFAAARLGFEKAFGAKKKCFYQ